MAITVIQMECFLEAARRESFSLAAANLYMSQPTLSRHIQALEEELGATLFVRANNTVRLSSIGEDIFFKLEEMYHAFQTYSADLHRIVDQHASRLRIAVLASLRLDDRLRKTIDELRRQYPNCQLELSHMDLSRSYDALMDGAVDLLVSLNVTMPPSSKVHSTLLREEHMCLAVPKKHPNAGLSQIAFRSIRSAFPELPYMVLDVNEFETPVQQELKDAQFAYTDRQLGKISGTFASLDTLQLMVDAGLCTTCVNESSILNENPNTQLIPLIKDDGDRAFSKICINLYWVDKNQNPMLNAFLRIWEKDSPLETPV